MRNHFNRKPIVYIASPYTKGDPAINVRTQMLTFDTLMDGGLVWPVAPLWGHFQHMAFPRHYEDWIAYDLALLPLYDACLRINSTCPRVGYGVSESPGADGGVEAFKKMRKPVFYSIDELYKWVKTTS